MWLIAKIKRCLFAVISVGPYRTGCWNNLPLELRCGLNMKCFAESYVFECLVPLVVLFGEGSRSLRSWSLVGGSGPVKWALIFLSSLAPLPVHCRFPGGRHNVTLRPITPWCHITSIMMNYSLLNSKTNKPFLLKLLFVSYLVTVTEKINKKVTNI